MIAGIVVQSLKRIFLESVLTGLASDSWENKTKKGNHQAVL